MIFKYLFQLPHTTAYEKLVGIVSGSGNGSNVGLQHQPREQGQRRSDKCELVTRKEDPCNASSTSAIAELSNFHVVTKQMDELNCSIKPVVLSETNREPECSFDNRVDVGLQTDEYDDPDIYYFAGGRSIACQTDSCEQYGPLIPLPSGPTPVIIVLDPTDSDTEMSMIMDTSITEPNTCDSLFRGSKLNGCATPVTTDPGSPVIGQANKNLTEYCFETTCTANNLTNIDSAVSTVVETKSSATQLSVGVLIEEVADNLPPNDGSGDCNTKQLEQLSMSKSEVTSNDEKFLEGTVKCDQVKTTFADKAKNGMLRQTSMQAKSVPNNMNRIGTGMNSKGNLNQKGKLAPSYRSNIASRCRTAVNTSKQQVRKFQNDYEICNNGIDSLIPSSASLK